ncbi:MAG: 3-phosphoserine/phosphohydroxythreonine transaminase [Mesosutterella sp.]|nr:3-phosphoserine/phosphohydroxythreonine transaminase [Mesosutterella sp.]
MRCFNFAPGPAALPLEVLEVIRDELFDFRGEGASIMEISHRSSAFAKVIGEAETGIRTLLGVPDGYDVLFMQGGGHQQFSAVPLNLLGTRKKADYIVNGTWSRKALKEAQKFCEVNVAALDDGTRAPRQQELRLDPDAAYVYYCDNETVHGVEFDYVPETGGVPLVADMSSNIMTRPVDVSRFGAIWFGAQKNFGIAGLAIALVRQDLIGKAGPACPVMLDWKTYAQSGSLFNTPPVFAIYVSSLVCRWLLQQGGVKEMQRRSALKSGLLYQTIDESEGFYRTRVQKDSRSRMNVTFALRDESLNEPFLAGALERGLKGVKGHRSVGGMRASLYNAVPQEGVQALADYMKEFARRHG